MRRCYLHFGTPKTGSTSIQHFLGSSGRSLFDLGFFVPTAGSSPGGGQHIFVKAIAGEELRAEMQQSPERLSQDLARHADKDVILSAEWLTRYFLGCGDRNKVTSFFADRGFEVVLVGYFRNQPQRFNSGYAQNVKRLQTRESFDEYVEHAMTSRAFDYRFWTDLAAASGYKLIARPFNAEVRTKGVVRDFLQSLGIDHEAVQAGVEARANPTPGPCAVAVALETVRRASARGHAWTHRQRVAAWKLFSRLTAEPRFAERPFCGLTTEAARAIQAQYAIRNNAFAEAAWGSDWDSIFSGDVAAEFEPNVVDPAEADPPTRELYEALLDRFWSGVLDIMRDPRLARERNSSRAAARA